MKLGQAARETAHPIGPDGANEPFVIAFNAGGNGYEYQGGGWSYPEADFTWTLGYESSIVLPAPASPGPYELVLDLFPFTAGPVTEQPLTVALDGREIARAAIARGGRVTCRAEWPAEPATAGRGLTLTLHHPGAARPSETKPDSGDQRLLAFAVRSLTLRRLPPLTPIPPPLPPAPGFDAGRHRLMLGFESLGMNCELGLVQRQCGAEPLGLLRFAFSPIQALLAGLEDRFARIGRPETTELRLHAPTGEFQVMDRAYGFLFHTWIYGKDGADPADLQKRECRRLPRLAAKLVETLEDAEKIFVFRGEAATSEAEVRRIVEAVRRYGDNTVLWVRAADASHPAEMVRPGGEGLLMGWVDRLAPMQDAVRFSFASWLRVLAATESSVHN